MLSRQTDNMANAIRLLVAMGGLAAQRGLDSGLKVYDALRKIVRDMPPGLRDLADSLAADAGAVFRQYADATADTHVLYEQMVVASLPSATEIAAAGLSARSRHPVDWAMTIENIGLAHEAMAGKQTCADPRAEPERAAECFAAALRVYDLEHMPYDHGMPTAGLERVRGKLAVLP